MSEAQKSSGTAELGNRIAMRLQWLEQGKDIDIAEFADDIRALLSALDRTKQMNLECMAECMDMLRQDLIAAGVIDKSVAPMFMTEAILAALAHPAPTDEQPSEPEASKEGGVDEE